jgi:CheY-like chemotaxis protein
MAFPRPARPFLAVVDDDALSARQTIRMLIAHGAPSVSWVEPVREDGSCVSELWSAPDSELPAMVVVDLKRDDATADCIAALRATPVGRDLLVVGLAAPRDPDQRQRVEAAGADAVFERHTELGAVRHEAASMVSFWVRQQRLSAVGT